LTHVLARVGVRDDVRDADAWYWELPAVAQLRDEGMALDAPWPRPQGGIWLRGEVMHERFSAIDRNAMELRAFDGVPLNARSHGEGFLALLESRTLERGLWILDEPESALSFRSSLRLLALLTGVVAAGSQVVLATHSPVLAAVPGATVYELDAGGFTARAWDELDLVQDRTAFFDDPQRMLHHLLDE
jgi:predicted ATPase